MKTNNTSSDVIQQEIQELRQEVARYRSLFAQLPLGIYIYQLEDMNDDRTLRMVAANPVVEHLAGLTPADVVGKTLDENFPGLRDQGLPQAFAEVIRTGKPFEVESVYSDERVIQSAFNVQARPLPDNSVAVLFENITQRKQTENDLHHLTAELEQRVAERTAELRYNQDMLHTVLESSPAAIYVKDLDGRFLRVNSRTSALLGVPPDQMENRLDYDLFPQEFADQWRANEQRAIATGEPIAIEETVIQDDGIHTFLSIRTPVYNDAGEVYAIGGVATDITERKRQEEALRLTQFALDSAVDAVFWFTNDGNVVYANEAACTSLGYSRDELLTMNVTAIDPNYTLEAARNLWDALQTEGFIQLETSHRRKDGSTFPVEVTINILEYTNKRFLCAFARDITERKQQEDDLRIFKTVFENASDAMTIARAEDNIITYYNNTHRRLYGCGDEHMGQPVQVLLAPEEYERVPAIMQQVLTEGAWSGTMQNQHSSGSSFPVLTSCFLIRDSAGNPESMVAIVRDISDMVAAEAEREALQQQLIEAQQHALRELSTPLIPIADRVVIMPLIGTIDSGRAQLIMETLLEGVAAHQAELAIVDITGVQVVDTQVAQALVQAAQAVRLLGAQVMLTGIQPQIAQTLVHLGIDLSGIATRGSLQSGIAAALAQR